MRLWNGLHAIREPFDASTVAIGMFDGLHVGHQALINEAVEDAKQHGRRGVVFTFNRHPLELIAPDKAPPYLTTPEQRAQIIEQLGVQDLVIARFDERFRELSPEAFLQFVVKGVLGAESLFVGFDFRFGHDQAGDPDHIRGAAPRLCYTPHVLGAILVAGEKASSSRARDLLQAGDLSGTEAVLGHPYVLRGEVVEGAKLGRQLGYPTANLRPLYRQVLPADGIYAAWARAAEGERTSAEEPRSRGAEEPESAGAAPGSGAPRLPSALKPPAGLDDQPASAGFPAPGSPAISRLGTSAADSAPPSHRPTDPSTPDSAPTPYTLHPTPSTLPPNSQRPTPLPAAVSIGFRPTVGGAERTVEAYLLDFEGDLYGRTVDLEFVARLREERRFDSLDALKAQIGADVEEVRRILQNDR